ncbi:MAG: CUAEP/CCAEP-tail radical SAM (seleno)protein [Acidimicrobiales bacterium]
MHVLLVSTYELGHQPLSAATTLSALVAAGHEVRCADVALDPLSESDVDWAERVALSVPMHTAMRIALRVADVVRARRPGLPICFFGLYAGVASERTLTSPADAVIAGEYETGVVAWAGGGDPGPAVQLGRVDARVPDRRALPALDRYAYLAVAGERRLVGSVAASRGCSHRCRHCPVPVVYRGRVRPVPIEAVLADVDQLVASGARHVSFADPDFLNAPHHARRVLHAMHDRHPDCSFDATIKVEHVLAHQALLPELADAGCAFVVSAFESVNDDILGILDKGHTAAQASEAVRALRACGIEVRPSWLPFTPWTSVGDLVALLDFVIAHDLVGNVDPVQYSVRLLVPDGSLLLGEEAMAPHLCGYDPERLGWRWAHPDPVLDRLQSEIAALVEAEVDTDPEATFEHVDALVRAHATGTSARPVRGVVSTGPRGERAHLSEPWFCCAEPTRAQLAPIA